MSGSTSPVLTGSINDVQLIITTDQGTAADGGVAVLTTGGPAVILRGTTASFDDLRVSSP